MLLGELEIALDVGHQLDALGVIWLVGVRHPRLLRRALTESGY